jgi:ATP-dependent DNA ligase
VVGNGAALFAAADRVGLEGIVSKKLSSRYRSRRSRSWLKAKCFAEAEFVVVGVQRADGGPATALLAREEGRTLAAAVTLGGTDRERFWRSVERLAVAAPAVPLARGTAATRLQPALRVRARYLKGSDKLRHATPFGLLRELASVR